MQFKEFIACIKNHYFHDLTPARFYTNSKKHYGLGMDKLISDTIIAKLFSFDAIKIIAD